MSGYGLHVDHTNVKRLGKLYGTFPRTKKGREAAQYMAKARHGELRSYYFYLKSEDIKTGEALEYSFKQGYSVWNCKN